MSNYAVILAGGKGERFWPLSTSKAPKQLLALVGDRPLLAQAVQRLQGLIPFERVFVITNQDLVEGCRKAAPELPAENIIGEPVGRDTAAAVALAGAVVKQRDPNAAFCILTADHIIGDPPVFQSTLSSALEKATREDVLITIGIPPSFPSTGFGYIEAEPSADAKFFNVERFVEKPNAEKAAEYLASGRFFWNSGMFIWSVKSLEAAFRAHRPVLADLMNLPSIEKILAAYPALEKISVDYALMEKATNIVMIPARFSWDDVGSWTALENHFPKDGSGNVIVGEGQLIGSGGNIIVSRDRLTAVVGLENVIVVQADGVTLVCARDKAQDIKKMVEKLRAESRFQSLL